MSPHSITKQLIGSGKITRGYMGATIQNLSDEMADLLGIGRTQGRGGRRSRPRRPGRRRPASQPGDVVVAVNGQTVTTTTEMTREVAKAHAGDTVAPRRLPRRQGARRSTCVRAPRPSERQLAAERRPPAKAIRTALPEGAAGPRRNPPVLGMSLAPDRVRRRASNTASPTRYGGVLVEGVKGSSDAGEKGLQSRRRHRPGR